MNPLSRVYVTADISGTRDSFIEIRNFFFGKKFLRRRKRKDSLKRNEIFFMKWIYDSLIESTWKMFERNSNNNKEKNNSTKSKLWIECWEFMLWVFCKYAWVLKDRKILTDKRSFPKFEFLLLKSLVKIFLPIDVYMDIFYYRICEGFNTVCITVLMK